MSLYIVETLWLAILCSYYRALLDHITKMAATLLRTSEVMTSQLHHASYLAVKELLVSPTWRYSHSCPQRKHTADIPQIVVTGCGDYKECSEIAGIHTYI